MISVHKFHVIYSSYILNDSFHWTNSFDNFIQCKQWTLEISKERSKVSLHCRSTSNANMQFLRSFIHQMLSFNMFHQTQSLAAYTLQIHNIDSLNGKKGCKIWIVYQWSRKVAPFFPFNSKTVSLSDSICILAASVQIMFQIIAPTQWYPTDDLENQYPL